MNASLVPLTKQLTVLTAIIAVSAFASVPAIADTTVNSAEASVGLAGKQNTATKMNLVEVAAGNSSFSTLVQAVKAAGLADTLANKGTFTIFAPTNEAFAALPKGALELLLKPENKKLLQRVLTYHVAAGKLTSNKLKTGSVKTLGGGLALEVTKAGVIVNDGSVVMADVPASNGVIHAVNRVMLPRDLRQALVSKLAAQ